MAPTGHLASHGVPHGAEDQEQRWVLGSECSVPPDPTSTRGNFIVKTGLAL